MIWIACCRILLAVVHAVSPCTGLGAGDAWHMSSAFALPRVHARHFLAHDIIASNVRPFVGTCHHLSGLGAEKFSVFRFMANDSPLLVAP